MQASQSSTKQLHIFKLLFLLGLLTASFISVIIWYELHHLHDENSLLENLQVVILLAGLLPYLAFRTVTPDVAVFNQAFALLCFSFLLREVDVEHLDVPVLVKTLGSGTGKVMLLALLWGGFLSVVIRKGHITNSVVRAFLDSDEFKILLLAVLLLAVSAIMDRQIFAVQFSRLYEEMAEVNAYLLMLLGSLMRSLPSAFFIHSDPYPG